MPACAVYDPQLVGGAAGSGGLDDPSGGTSMSAGAHAGGAAGANAGANNLGGSPASSAGQPSAGSKNDDGGAGGARAGASNGGGGASAGGAAGAAMSGAGGAPAGGAPAGGAPAGGAPAGGSSAAGAGGGGAPGVNPCDRTNWKASASRSSLSMNPPQLYNPPIQAIDGTVSTRWSSGLAEDGTEWFLVDLGARASHLTQVVLDTAKDPTDFPVGYALELSTDGTAYAQVASGAGAITTTINFTDTPARYIRVKQTGVGKSWWTIHELTITCLQ